MKVALITDQHFGARESSAIILKHQLRFYDEIFFPRLEQYGINTIIILGDFFDKRKYTNNYIVDRAKKKFFDIVSERKYTVYMIVGNHDSYYKNTLEVNTPELLSKEYDCINVISSPRTIDINGTSIAMIPWICSDNEVECMNTIQNSPSDICMGHFEIEGFQMYRGVESHGGFSKTLFNRYDYVFSGHYHHKSTTGNITYLGAPYEMTWQDYGDPRGFHIFDLNTRTLDYIQNPITLFVKLEYNDKDVEPIDLRTYDLQDTFIKLIVINKTDYYKFDSFLNRLYSKGAYDIKIVEDIGDFESVTISESVKIEDTQTVLNHYIDSTQTNVCKSKIKAYIQSLYTEALNMEA